MNISKRAPLLVRFHAAYAINPETGCWEWHRGRDSKGYGVISHQNKTLKAHRVSWEIHYGPIPDDPASYHGVMVCHHCDNPRCVNPGHLFLGSAADNSSDRDKKGRAKLPHGDEHWTRRLPGKVLLGSKKPQSKLTESDVLAIRASNEKGRDLAHKYSVTESTISTIKHRKIWRHI